MYLGRLYVFLTIGYEVFLWWFMIYRTFVTEHVITKYVTCIVQWAPKVSCSFVCRYICYPWNVWKLICLCATIFYITIYNIDEKGKPPMNKGLHWKYNLNRRKERTVVIFHDTQFCTILDELKSKYWNERKQRYAKKRILLTKWKKKSEIGMTEEENEDKERA